MIEITLNSVVIKAGDLLSTDLDEETILMSIQQGFYYGMETTARRIWQLLEQRRTVADLCRDLSVEYNISSDTCQQDLLPFLEELRKEGLIIVE